MNNFLKTLLGRNRTDQEIGSFDDSRVVFQPRWNENGETVHIDYQGLLKDSGAESVFLHYGFDSWNAEVATVMMEREENGKFGVDIPAHFGHNHHEINFCFKDSANNWDNNNGWNWTVSLH